MKVLKVSILNLIFLGFIGSLVAQNKIETALGNLVKDSELQYASISFSVIDIDKNEMLVSKNPELSLPTASTMKAITTGTTLALMGRDYRFETCLEYDGELKDGILNGNLYITGSGDPCLGSPYMSGVPSLEMLANEFIQAVKKAGIKQIKGAVIGDGSYYEVSSLVPTWQWMDMGNHFGAGVSGLNLHDNLYFLSFEQTSALDAQPRVIEVKPNIPNLRFYNELTSAGKNTGDNANIYAAPFGTEAWLRGTIPVGNKNFTIKGAIPDPELFAANWLTESLTKAGVMVAAKPTSQRVYRNGKPRTNIHTHYSPPLHQIIKHTNEDSRNMYCESFIKTIGKKIKKEGTEDAGIASILDFWQTRGIDTKGFFMQDGSGLSARNGISSKVMAQIMRKMFIDTKTFDGYYDLLAVSGESGTFKYLGRNTSLQGNLHGKGGSMNRIRSFTGFITTRSKRRVSFSLIVNNYSCSGYAIHQKLERVLLSIAEFNE